MSGVSRPSCCAAASRRSPSQLLLRRCSPGWCWCETTVARVMHPVGPSSQTTYWIRRTLVMVLAVALLIGIVWYLAGRTSRTAAAPASPPQAAPAAPAPPPPSYDADGRLLCVDTSVALTAKVPAEVRSGSTVIVGMTITNSGTEACRRDVSGTLQVFTVFGADGTRLWSTADCFPGEGTEVRDLTPGQSVEYTVKWSGTTSAPGCAGERTPLPPGSYTLIAQLGALSSPPAAFTVG